MIFSDEQLFSPDHPGDLLYEEYQHIEEWFLISMGKHSRLECPSERGKPCGLCQKIDGDPFAFVKLRDRLRSYPTEEGGDDDGAVFRL